MAAPITVRVEDEAGAPIAGATVQVQRYDHVEPPYAVATTDANGNANYELGAASFSPDFFGRVAAWKAGLAVAGTNLNAGTTTLTLAANAQVSGAIEDENGVVEGVTVQLQSVNVADKYLFVGIESPLSRQLSARTDAQGKFTLQGVPADAKLGLRVTGERYASQSITAQSGGVVSVKLRPGATLRGQVLDLTGAPLADLRVMAQGQDRGGDGWAEAQTDAAGFYRLAGLSSGTYNVLFDAAPDANYAVAAREGAVAAAGETSEVETARAVEGVVVRGRVIDAVSKAGVENISVGVYGPARPKSGAAVESFDTDAEGNFAARVVPGANKFYVMGAGQKWIRSEKQYDLDISANGAEQTPVFELTPALQLRGRIVDEAGQGVATKLALKQKWQEWALKSDENGDFTVYGPVDGEVTVGHPRFEQGDPEPWEIVAAPTLTLPTQQALKVVVKPALLGTFAGLIQDQNGAPLEGVKVELNVETGAGEQRTSQFKIVFSDAAGRVKYPNLRSDQSVTLRGVEKTGYDRDAGGELKRVGNDWNLQTVMLRERAGQLSGRVLLSGGAPAAGALVFAAGNETTADAQGNFALKSLPSGTVDVVVYAARQFGWNSADTDGKDAPLELKLAPQSLQPTDRDLAGEMITRAKVLAATTNYYATARLKLRAPDDAKRALEELIANPKREQLAQTIYTRANDPGVPLDLLLRAVRAIDTPSWRLYGATMLFAKRNDWPDDETTRALLDTLANDAKTVAEANNASDKWMAAIGLVGLAPIIERFEGEAAGDAAFTRAVQWIWKQFPAKGQGNTPSRDDTLSVVAELVAANSPHLYGRFFDYIAPESVGYSRSLQDGAVALAKSRGLEVAAPYLRRLIDAPTPEPDSNGNVRAVKYMAVQATRESIVLGGKSAPALALELARAVEQIDEGAPGETKRALAEAAFFQPPAVAAQLWLQTLPGMSADRAAQVAIRVLEIDAPLGRELLDRARKKLEDAPDTDNYWERSNVPAFAFYEAKFDAARARYRLEKAWQTTLAKNDNQREFGDLVRAMAAIDGERAFEWASLIPQADDNRRNARIDAFRKAAQYLEADEELRARVDFERWGRGDTVFVD